MSENQNTISADPIEVRILEAASADVTFSEWMSDGFSEEGGF